jgi:hypothetical protein
MSRCGRFSALRLAGTSEAQGPVACGLLAGRLVTGDLAAVGVRDLAGDLGIHSDSSAGVLDGQ